MGAPVTVEQVFDRAREALVTRFLSIGSRCLPLCMPGLDDEGGHRSWASVS